MRLSGEKLQCCRNRRTAGEVSRVSATLLPNFRFFFLRFVFKADTNVYGREATEGTGSLRAGVRGNRESANMCARN